MQTHDTATFASREIQLPFHSGLTLRETARLVQEAKRFHCDISIRACGMVANGKSILGVASLPLSRALSLSAEAHGQDSQACLEALAKVLEKEVAADRAFEA
jgi:phosphotransferase system HPr (HPr) family protein